MHDPEPVLCILFSHQYGRGMVSTTFKFAFCIYPRLMKIEIYVGFESDAVTFYFCLYLTANGFSSGGSGTTIRHNTQITHIIQNNTTIKRNTVHKIHTQLTPYTE
jgi:hypothetical protein